MYIYATDPLDLDWCHIHTIQRTISTYINEDEDLSNLRSFISTWLEVESIIKSSPYVYNAISYEPRVLWQYAGEFELTPTFIFKSEDNGDTYIISPILLPHLNAYKIKKLP